MAKASLYTVCGKPVFEKDTFSSREVQNMYKHMTGKSLTPVRDCFEAAIGMCVYVAVVGCAVKGTAFVRDKIKDKLCKKREDREHANNASEADTKAAE